MATAGPSPPSPPYTPHTPHPYPGPRSLASHHLFTLLPVRAASASSSVSASSSARVAERSALDDQKLINEEFKVWKKNTPFLYDLLLIHALEWPSLTCQWLPETTSSSSSSSSSSPSSSPPSDSSDDYETHRLLLGTHTTDGEGNYILIAETRLPTPNSSLTTPSTSSRPGGYGSVYGQMEIVQAINHQGEVNRARYMPGNSALIASKTTVAEVWIFDRGQHVNKANRASQCKPDYRLLGHEKEGYGLSWSTQREGHLLSGSEDALVCMWDVTGSVGKRSSEGVTIPALATYRGHSAHVEDVAWHSSHPHLFASVSDDKHVMLWDTRTKGSAPAQDTSPHTAEINCVAFSPFTPTCCSPALRTRPWPCSTRATCRPSCTRSSTTPTRCSPSRGRPTRRRCLRVAVATAGSTCGM